MVALTPEQERLRVALTLQGKSAAWLARQPGVEVSDMTVSRWLGRAKSKAGTRVPDDKQAAVEKALRTRGLFRDEGKAR